MHLLIFLNLADEFLKAFHIDELICAKLLIIKTDLTGEFIKIITSVILYGLYGVMNPNLPCMNNAQDSP